MIIESLQAEQIWPPRGSVELTARNNPFLIQTLAFDRYVDLTNEVIYVLAINFEYFFGNSGELSDKDRHHAFIHRCPNEYKILVQTMF